VPSERVERRLAAIFAADMVGYSRLVEADEEGTIARQKAHRKDLIDPKIADNHGRIVKTTGDGMLVEFASVVDAVRCAVEVQQAMAEREAGVPDDRRIRYRVGVNLGDIVIDDDDVMGDGVNVAARLEALAEPGGVLISGTAFDQLKQKLNVGYRFQGERKVKNIAEPVRVYEVVPDPKAGTMRGRQRLSPKVWRWTASAIVLLLLVAGTVWWRPWVVRVEPVRSAKSALPLPKKPSIAVLPFANMSGDKTQDYFADGLTEDLITDLAKISGLFVIARNSSFTYKGKSVDVRKVGRELGVRYILEGSVRRAGGKVRINAQLIEASSGQHLWAERYDGELSDIFVLQDKVRARIIKALAVHLNASETKRHAVVETRNATAYDAFLRGWQHYRQRSRKDYQAAIAQFKRAVDLDPDYARAHAALALVTWTTSRRRWDYSVAPSVSDQNVRHHLKLALRSPTTIAYRVSSLLALENGRHSDAIAYARRALEVEPNNAESEFAMANALVFSGDPKAALMHIRKAMRLDPHYPAEYRSVLGLAQFGLARFKEAADQFELALKQGPKDKYPAAALAAAYGHLGRKAEAASAMKIYSSQFPSFTATGPNPASILLKWPFREPSDAERFGSGLLKAGLCCRKDLDSFIATLRARKRRPGR
jgi:adenylate cyclase